MYITDNEIKKALLIITGKKCGSPKRNRRKGAKKSC